MRLQHRFVKIYETRACFKTLAAYSGEFSSCVQSLQLITLWFFLFVAATMTKGAELHRNCKARA